MFHKAIRFAQFYFIDTFILLCCGAEFHLLSFHVDTTKDDLKQRVKSFINRALKIHEILFDLSFFFFFLFLFWEGIRGIG